MRTLIVDDNIEIVDLLKMLLPKAEVMDSASNGLEALEAVKTSLVAETPYDLICMDIMMPQMDGRTALREIRKAEEGHGIRIGDGSKIVMITALGDSKNVFGSFHRDGCDGYIIKPFEREAVLKSLQKIGAI